VVSGVRRVVGRDAELARLAPVTGARAALVVCGEAGIGKSTVWEAALERFRGAGFAALVARPVEAEGSLAFAGLTDLLGDVIDEVGSALSPPRNRMLRVAMLLDEPGEDAVDPRGVGLAVLDALRSLARAGGGLVVALDDAQWLDAETAAALAFALRRLDGEPVVALISRRGGIETSIEQSLPPARVERVELSGLSVGALLRIVHDQLQRSVPLPLIARIHDATDGNPFYALEFARQSLQQGAVPLPSSLGVLAEDRLKSLPAATLGALLEVAALADPREEMVDPGALEAAFAAGVLERGGARVRFTHPLLRSAVYEMATPAQRRQVHHRLADRVAGEERARHLGLGTAGSSEAVAATLDSAAAAVASRGGVHAAVELAELAVHRSPPETRAERVLSAGEYRLRAGDPSAARALLEAALPRLVGDLRARALILLAWTREDDFELAGRLCEEALEVTRDDRLASDAHARRAELALGQGQLWLALEHGREAVRHAEAAGDPRLIVRSLSYLGNFQTLAGSIEAGVLERALELEQTLDRPPVYYGPGAMLGLRLMWSDRLRAAREQLERACADATAAGEEVARVLLLLHLAQAQTRAGEWRQARVHADEAILLAEQIGLVQLQSFALSVSSMIAALTGQVAQARAAAESGLSASRGAREVIFEAQNLAVLGFLELSLEDPAAADSYLRDLPALYERMGYGNPGANPFLPNAIEAAIAIGDRPRAEDLTAQLQRRAELLDDAWARATGLRCRGLLAAAAGRNAEAVAALEDALRAHERSENPFERARTLLALGELDRRSNRRRAARERLEEARRVFVDLGAELWARRASVELARIGGRAARGERELTATERRVALLVAEGKTNREVAASLVVSERTVATHLTHIYGKLGVRSRTELARHLVG